MDNLRPINLEKVQSKKVKKWFKGKTLGFVAVFFVLLGLFFYASGGGSSSGVLDVILNPGNQLETDKGRVNVLLLGIAGGKHDGPNLTDTIIIASYNPHTQSVDLVSLPRDLWIQDQQIKVNALYQAGLNKGMGIGFVQDQIGNILGIKIPYGLRVDFSGFVKAVNLIDGIDVDVERSFDDYAYPVEGKEDEMCGLLEKEVEVNEEQAKSLNIEVGKHKALVDKDDKIATTSAKANEPLKYTDNDVLKYFPCRFEHLEFTKGITHMDGEIALKFVRSRHGTGIEGSDFARSKRQQRVIQSIREKILSTQTLTDPAKIIGLMNTFGSSVEVNIPVALYPKFLEVARDIKQTRVHVIDGSINPPILINPSKDQYGGAWVLVPPKDDYKVIANYISDLLSGSTEATSSAGKK